MLEADTEGRGGTATAPPIKLGARNNSEMRDKGKVLINFGGPVKSSPLQTQ